MTVFMLVPMFAPIIGQWVMDLGGWRSVFGLYLAMAAVSGGWHVFVPETLDPAMRRELRVRPIAAAFAEVLTTRSTMLYTFSAALVFGAFVVYLSTAQQVLAEGYGLGPLFPWAFGALAFAFALASLANSRMVMRLGMRRLALVSLSIMIVVSAVATLYTRMWTADGLPPFWLFMAFMSAIFFSVAVLFANFNALALQPLGHLAGTAASVVNTVATLGAVPVGYVIAQAYDGSVAPLFTGFAVLGAGSLGFMYMAERARAPA